MKEWKDLTLTDDYLFSQIMKDEEFCKLFLEMLMGIPQWLQHNYVVTTSYTNIAVPLFVPCNIWKHRFTFWFPYRCLMQTTNKLNLVKRMRYYHSAIDVDSLLRGNPYDQLKKSYVIFICNFDLYGDGYTSVAL